MRNSFQKYLSLLLLCVVLSSCGVELNKLAPGMGTQSGGGGDTDGGDNGGGGGGGSGGSGGTTPTPTPAPQVLTGTINSMSWTMSSGQAKIINLGGSNYVQVILWGPVPHTACVPYTENPATDARHLQFIAPAAAGTYPSNDLIVIFYSPDAGDIVGDFAKSGSLTLSTVNGSTVSGQITNMTSTNGKSLLNGTFSVTVCP